MVERDPVTPNTGDEDLDRFLTVCWSLRDSFWLSLKKQNQKQYERTAHVFWDVGCKHEIGFEDVGPFSLLEEFEAMEMDRIRESMHYIVSEDSKELFNRIVTVQSVVDGIGNYLVKRAATLL